MSRSWEMRRTGKLTSHRGDGCCWESSSIHSHHRSVFRGSELWIPCRYATGQVYGNDHQPLDASSLTINSDDYCNKYKYDLCRAYQFESGCSPGYNCGGNSRISRQPRNNTDCRFNGCGTLIISSTPVGADVYLDSAMVGKTPLTLGSVSPGAHTVELKSPGYLSVSIDVVLSADKPTEIPPEMVKAPSGILLSPLVAIAGCIGATVLFVDRQEKGNITDIFIKIPG